MSTASTLAVVKSGLTSAGVPDELVVELLNEFSEAKRRYHLRDWGPAAVNGGRFSEAVLRICDWATRGSYVALSDRSFKAETTINQLSSRASNIPGSDSFRLHIPRTVRVIYDVRNSRNTGHLSSLSLNHQDAAIVIRGMEWILAELVQIYHNASPAMAESIVLDIVTKEVPLIEMFGDFPKVLADLSAPDHCLVLLYWRGAGGVTRSELRKWIRPNAAKQLARTLRTLDSRHQVHLTGDLVEMTAVGFAYVEDKNLIRPA